jgi:nucleoside-diphosphate-sugar epimerase
VDEDVPLRGDLGPYSAAKLAVEKLAATVGNIVLLRPGIVYGPESPSWCGLIGRLLETRRIGDLGALGRGTCNLVHVDDVAMAVLAALRQQGVERQAFNLGMPAAPSWNEYFQSYARALGVPLRHIGPLRLGFELKLLGPALKLMEIAARVARLPPPPPPIRPWLLELCRHQIQLRVRKAEEMLGLQWKPLEDSLGEVAAWFHAEAA